MFNAWCLDMITLQCLFGCGYLYRTSWSEAEEACASHRMNLPRVNSFEDLTMLLDLKRLRYSTPYRFYFDDLMIHIDKVDLICCVIELQH